MKEQQGLQAVRLEIKGRRLHVEQLFNGGAASDDTSSNRGCLYVISHAVDKRASAERLLERVEAVAEESYRRAPGGVTNRLRQAVRNANRYLYLRNCVRGEEEALLASLACVAVRGTDAYACGVGPHVILVLSPGRVRGHDQTMSALNDEEKGGGRHNGQLLGRSATLEDPRFFYRQVLPGDQLLVVASHGVECFSSAVDQLKGALREEDIETAGEALGDLVKDETEGAALLLRVPGYQEWPPFAQLAPDSSAAGLPSRPRGMLSLFSQRIRGAETAGPRPSEASETATPKTSGDEFAARKEGRTRAAREAPGRAQKQVPATGTEPPRGAQAAQQSLRTGKLAGALLLSLLWDLRGSALKAFVAACGYTKRMWRWSRRHRLLERLAAAGRVALAGFFRGLKGLLVGILPERQHATTTYAATARPMARARVLGFHPSGRSRAVIGALIVVAVFALVATSAVRVRARLQEVEADRLVEQVAESLALADQQKDRESASAALDQAEALLVGATDAQRENPAFQELLAELATRRDGLAGVVRLPFSEELSVLEAGGGVGNLIIHDDSAYLLDASGQRVSRYKLDLQGHLLSNGEVFTWQLPAVMTRDADARIRDMVWVEAENGRLTPALLMLTSDGSVLEMSRDGSVRTVDVADRTAWQKPIALATYSGNLYVLDTGHGNVFKYIPDGDDYGYGAMEYVQTSAEIDWSRMMDIAIDGDVYLLASDGSVKKFTGGELQPFTPKQWPERLTSAASIFTEPDHKSILVADPQQGRLVEFRGDGQFVHQYRAAIDGGDYIGELRTFAVDTGRNRLFVGTASGLASTNLSVLPEQVTD